MIVFISRRNIHRVENLESKYCTSTGVLLCTMLVKNKRHEVNEGCCNIPGMFDAAVEECASHSKSAGLLLLLCELKKISTGRKKTRFAGNDIPPLRYCKSTPTL